jgi:two-component system, OmpR family, phosphate regulon sensor histidine kinase PhoR
MPAAQLREFAVLIRREIDGLLANWRRAVRELPSARHLDVPTLNDHLPNLLRELADALDARSDETIAEALREGSPPAHGQQRVQDGFDIVEVVAEYNIMRGCVHDLAEANGVSLQGEAFHIINRVLDQAIGLAVESYATAQARDVQRRREEYLAFVAHDLRTPLNALALAARVLDVTLAPGSSPVSARMLKSLHRNIRQLEGLVAKVLEENSNLQTEAGVKLERRYLDLWPLIEALVHDIHPLAGTGSTELINEVPEDLVVFADASLLRRVFQNLIANAIAYTPRGEVHIGAQTGDSEGSAECWVTDSGTGIPPDLLAGVFDKGTGDAERSDSTGLGLAIVKTFVEAHGGTVHAESELGRGTTIRFTLPGVAPANR